MASKAMSTPEHLIIGQIVGPFGVRGEMKVTIMTEFPQRFRKMDQVILAPFAHVEPGLVPAGSLDPATVRPQQEGMGSGPRATFPSPKAPTTFEVESTRSHKGQLLLKIRGVDAPEQAEALRGS